MLLLPVRDGHGSLMPIKISDINFSVSIKEFLDSAVKTVEIFCEVSDLMLGVQLLIYNEFNIIREGTIPY